MNTKRINFWLPIPLLEKLKALSLASGVPVVRLVKDAITKLIEEKSHANT